MRVLHPFCKAPEKRQGGRVAELVAEPLGEDEAERACASRAQATRARVRARVAEGLRGGEHPFPHLVRNELGAAECMRGASDGHAGPFRNVAEPWTPRPA